MTTSSGIGFVAIARNEGERLKACLRSLSGHAAVVYVDSGSTDGSIEFARSMGIEVVTLDMSQPFTAARARNAGVAALTARWPQCAFVQMIDGDCEVEAGWVDAAVAALGADSSLAVVFGRRRERHRDLSIYNRICDDEWNVPVGEALHCGGDAMFRTSALMAAGGYDASLIAGEEPDLCLRLRANGWRVVRIDAPMTIHDAAMTRFHQWWRRNVRSGHAYAEHVARNGQNGFPGWRHVFRSDLVWAGALPAIILAALAASAAGVPLASTMAAGLLMLYPLQWLRFTMREVAAGRDIGTAAQLAFFLLLSKFAQVVGIATYWRRRVLKSRFYLIEYKAG